MIKPSFFIVGVQKGGTTTLHEWLSQYPQICLPKIKETHFFSDEDRYALGWDWYEKQFSAKALHGSPIVGEVDPDYLFFPEAALRIREAVKSPKIIILLREPLRRAYSQYLMTSRRGHENLSFAEALAAESERCASGERFSLDHFSYIARGMYSCQILRLKQVFPSSEMIFIKHENLFDQGENNGEFNKICSFIGIDPGSLRVHFDRKINQAASSRFIFLRNFIYRPSQLKRWLGKLIYLRDLKLRLAMWADQINSIPDEGVKNKFFADEVPVSIHVLLESECKKLSALTGLNVDDWINAHHLAIIEKSKAGALHDV